jgi:alkyl hydroperoxide reductase subunit AhpC
LKQNQVELGELNSRLVLDLNETITNKYGLLTNDSLLFSGVFIIDKEGIIQYCNFNNLLCGRNITELLRILKSIQYIKENPGQACPVD